MPPPLLRRVPGACPAAGSRRRGATLLDALVGTALMLTVFLGIYGAFRLSVEAVTSNKARAGAIALGNERMEYLKSLSYGQIGVSGGIPAGIVPQEETLVQNGVSYRRRTMVFYSDDPADGLGGADSNGIIADFKTIRVEINWPSRQGERSVTLVGRVSPPGIETAVPGGTLTIKVVNAAQVPVINAQVDIANASTSPAINIRSYTNDQGSITFIGAPAASNYQIVVTKPGYSSARTYAVSVENPNPDPRHLTVANDQTTSQEFAIDYVAVKNIETFRQISTSTWSDTFGSEANIATSSNTQVQGGSVRLAGSDPYPPAGSVRSVAIAPQYLFAWKELRWSDETPAQTDIRYRLYDATGAEPVLVPEGQLPGNSAGFTDAPLNLSGIPTSTSKLALGAELMTSDSAATPRLDSWTLEYAYGPEPLPNVPFTLRGVKTIGNNPAVYKYDASHTSDSAGRLSIPDMEWDTYAISLTPASGYSLSESCAPQPEALAPGTSQTTRIYLLPYSTHSLLVDVRASGGALIAGASVRATSTAYDATVPSGACGQSYFGSLVAQEYSLTVSAPGYQPSGYLSANVSGASQYSVVLTPQ